MKGVVDIMLNKSIQDIIDERKTVAAAKKELNFLKTYISNNQLTDYLSKTAAYDQVKGGKKSVLVVNYDQQLLTAIDLKDHRQELIWQRYIAIQEIDYPHNKILEKKYIEKLPDEENPYLRDYSERTRQRILKAAYLQFAFKLGIQVYYESVDNDQKCQEIEENDKKLCENQGLNSQNRQATIQDNRQVTIQATIQADDYRELLLEYCKIPRSREEMQNYCNITNRPYFSGYILKPLLENNSLKMMFPEKPNSPNQRYFTSEKQG